MYLKNWHLLAVLAFVLSACDISRQNANYIDKQVESLDFDIHEVEYSSHPNRFNVASFSHINRDSKQKSAELKDVQQVTTGSYQNWTWSVYADATAYKVVSALAERQSTTIQGKDGPRAVNVPSWNDAFTEFAKTASTVFGDKNLPLEVRITIVGEQVDFKKFVAHNDDQHLILDYYFAISDWATKDAASEYQWMVDTVATVGHEYSHSFVDAYDVKLPNAITDEVMAYTFEQCVKLSVVGAQAGISYLDKGGQEIDPKQLDFAKLIHTQGSASQNAYYLAEYDTVYVLGKSSIGKDDVATKNKLLGLCVAQYQHINDFENSFYPLEYVKPVQYVWNGYK